jgi:hypothetical protein
MFPTVIDSFAGCAQDEDLCERLAELVVTGKTAWCCPPIPARTETVLLRLVYRDVRPARPSFDEFQRPVALILCATR